jgi:hypothetical protein
MKRGNKKNNKTTTILNQNIKRRAKKIKKSLLLQKIRKIKTEHKLWFVVIISILLLFFIFSGARLYLLFNFLLGSDTLVQLKVERQDFFLKNSETGTAKFDIYVSTNLFCEAECEYIFQDISNGYTLDRNNFSTRLSNLNQLEYALVAPDHGEGQVLYSFQVSCESKKDELCDTDEKEKKRSYLLALNYELSEEQKKFREESTIELQKMIFETDELKRIDFENKEMIEILNDFITINQSPKNNISLIEKELDDNLNLWKKYEYEFILRDGLTNDINITRKKLVDLNDELSLKFGYYNNFTKRIRNTRMEISNLMSNKNISVKDYDNIFLIVRTYNDLVKKTSKISDLDSDFNFLIILNENIKNTKNNINVSIAGNFTYPKLESFNFEELEKPFKSDYSSGRFIGLEEPMCCYKGDCDICCTDDCINDKEKYPIVLLHGHSFNDAISAESSIDDLWLIKEELVRDGIIDGGYLILKPKEEMGIFARTSRQIVFAASYYFDIYHEKEKSFVLQTKKDSLDTYALRLNDIIENVKKITNRDKVYIVAHSMGGLVSRRYMQIFGDSDVEKIIMLGTPNHGIDGFVLSSCPVLGADIHCSLMDKNSLFINKLNYGKKPDINVSNVIGIGCKMNNADGDGVVKNNSAYLSWAKNYYIEGNCSGVDFLHRSMLDVKKYPEIYSLIKKELKIN